MWQFYGNVWPYRKYCSKLDPDRILPKSVEVLLLLWSFANSLLNVPTSLNLTDCTQIMQDLWDTWNSSQLKIKENVPTVTFRNRKCRKETRIHLLLFSFFDIRKYFCFCILVHSVRNWRINPAYFLFSCFNKAALDFINLFFLSKITFSCR